MSARPRTSVCLPTFNSERYLEEILDAVRKQRTGHAFEVVAIDSGSTDSTLAILERHDVRTTRIPNAEFRHGSTRNAFLQSARGELLVFITHSATPADDGWLEALIRPFAEDPRIVAVFGKHLPRKTCNPYVAHDIDKTFRWISPHDVERVETLDAGVGLDDLPVAERHRRRFFSNANSAVRRSYLEQHPFAEVDYAEDQILGEEVLRSGYAKVYAPDAAVFHSHSLPPWRYFQRRYDEYSGLRRAGNLRPGLAPWRHVKGTYRRWRDCVRSLWRSRRYGLWGNVLWTFGVGIYAVLDEAAIALARVPQPAWLRTMLSLDHSTREG